jgi:predicted  nucleic acid-binding Zn-ribbon protein
MNKDIVKCRNGHTYDKSLNRSGCPTCGVSEDTSHGADQNNSDKTKAYSAPDKRSNMGADRTDSSLEPGATTAIWGKILGIDPVVGWLVCVEGANKGRDYRIQSGLNNIGRDTTNQISIVSDDTISREAHCTLFYDHKKMSFYLTPGSGRSGVYANDNLVLQPTQLSAYDKLEIGQSKLLFIPFCGEQFHWKAEPDKKDEKANGVNGN